MKILIVDDDPGIVDSLALALALHWNNAVVLSAHDGEQGLALFIRESPEVTLLDVGLPGMSGWEVLKRIRACSSAPVLLLTAHGEEMNRVKGLELGADDYVTKPFGHLELVARIRAVLRRVEGIVPSVAPPEFISADLAVNFDTQEVTIGGRPVQLTPTEYKLLSLLVRNAGHILSAEMLLARVWGAECRDEIDYLKTYVSRLRRKLGDPAVRPRYILTERGAGYRFARLPATG